MITYKKAFVKDIYLMQKLVQEQVELGIILERSDNEISTNIRSYILAFDDDNLVGFAALHIYTPFLAEVRSLVVSSLYQGKKIGSTLVEKCIEDGKSLGLKEILALTYKKSFFEHLGFVEIQKEELPESKIWADCIKCKHFPICNEISMIKTL